jgi:hypothetical protein
MSWQLALQRFRRRKIVDGGGRSISSLWRRNLGWLAAKLSVIFAFIQRLSSNAFEI